MSPKHLTTHNFDRLAKYYDPALRILLLPFGGEASVRKKAADAIVSVVGMDKKLKVADVGCGTGGFIPYLPDKWDIFCFEPSEKMLEKAKLKNKRKYVTFLQKSVFELEEYAEEFDLTVSFLFLHEFEPKKSWQAFEKLLFITKPGGHLAVIDFFGQNSLNWKIFSFLLSLIEPVENIKSMSQVLPFLKFDARLKQVLDKNLILNFLKVSVYQKN